MYLSPVQLLICNVRYEDKYMRYRYLAPMDLEQIISILDEALAKLTRYESENKYLLQLVANRDKVIERLQSQLTTCTTVLTATEEEAAALHEKLSKLWDVLFPGDLEHPPQ